MWMVRIRILKIEYSKVAASFCIITEVLYHNS